MVQADRRSSFVGCHSLRRGPVVDNGRDDQDQIF